MTFGRHMACRIGVCGIGLFALAGLPVRAECINCNYGAAIALLALAAGAGILGLVVVVRLIARQRVPVWLWIVTIILAAPPLLAFLVDWINRL